MPAYCRCLLPLLALLVVRTALCDDDSAPGSSENSFQWKQAIAQSFLALSIANIERVTSQEDTRNALHGPFWKGYVDSIENLHGFNDGDGFFTSYVVHSMEGSFAGFIERQNDPNYRTVEFGLSERYWISTVRSLAFSSVYSTVWSATVFGEPGIGFVEKHNEPGLVDLVGTQTLGYAWMIGEDAIDRYLVKRIERRVRNPYVRALARGALNPTRSYANILAFHTPWHRDTRPGVREYRPDLDDLPGRNETGPRFQAKAWPERTAFELSVEPVMQRYLGSKGKTCIGAGGKGAVQFSHTDLVFNIDGCELFPFPQQVTGDALNYTVGPRWRYAGRQWQPSIEILVGGTKITHVTTNLQEREILTEQAESRNQPPPDYGSYHTAVDTNGLTVMANIGLSYRINDAFSWRIGTLGYQHSWMLSRLEGSTYNQAFRFTMGIGVTLGPWR